MENWSILDQFLRHAELSSLAPVTKINRAFKSGPAFANKA
jgi:hypothetical protein